MHRHSALTNWLIGLPTYHRLVAYVGASLVVSTLVQIVTKGV